ncbi:Collagen alpha-5(VI) chain [Actinoplanes sp. SE50]|nr:Collagen alpha-5(VI) chain [Actinoplanes sp. SE50/110]ATO80687.1 Collagen alpha-5(VI) chain [Actinoplanes sp. SE50]SLL98094.1 hypothetical protein ACSP50_1316 [Actinoplanes sp. SE50/110]
MTRTVRSRRTGAAHQPLYARMLGLRHLSPGGLLCFVFLEGAIALGVLLALAELVSWWGVLVLPMVVAAMVKFNDVVAGWLSPPASAAEPVAARAAVQRAERHTHRPQTAGHAPEWPPVRVRTPVAPPPVDARPTGVVWFPPENGYGRRPVGAPPAGPGVNSGGGPGSAPWNGPGGGSGSAPWNGPGGGSGPGSWNGPDGGSDAGRWNGPSADPGAGSSSGRNASSAGAPHAGRHGPAGPFAPRGQGGPGEPVLAPGSGRPGAVGSAISDGGAAGYGAGVPDGRFAEGGHGRHGGPAVNTAPVRRARTDDVGVRQQMARQSAVRRYE